MIIYGPLLSHKRRLGSNLVRSFPVCRPRLLRLGTCRTTIPEAVRVGVPFGSAAHVHASWPASCREKRKGSERPGRASGREADSLGAGTSRRARCAGRIGRADSWPPRSEHKTPAGVWLNRLPAAPPFGGKGSGQQQRGRKKGWQERDQKRTSKPPDGGMPSGGFGIEQKLSGPALRPPDSGLPAPRGRP